jgi:hypothetical protein
MYLCLFYCILISHNIAYGYQLVTIIFVLNDQPRKIEIWADHGESMNEAAILQMPK